MDGRREGQQKWRMMANVEEDRMTAARGRDGGREVGQEKKREVVQRKTFVLSVGFNLTSAGQTSRGRIFW